jgi:hypothetical protein
MRENKREGAEREKETKKRRRKRATNDGKI